MEQWEIDLRAKLEKEVPEGSYRLDSGQGVFVTGKQGYIECEVLLRKKINELCKTNTNPNISLSNG